MELRVELGIEVRAGHSTVMHVLFFFLSFLMTVYFLSSWQRAL